MSELSPQAQAVLNAVVDGAHPAFAPIAAPMAAAALRAVVQNSICIDDYGDEYIDPNDILKIVEELE